MTFDDIEIDGRNYELRRNGELVSVEPNVFDVIKFFSENTNRLGDAGRAVRGKSILAATYQRSGRLDQGKGVT